MHQYFVGTFVWVSKIVRIRPTMKECNYIQHHLLLLTWTTYATYGYSHTQFWRLMETVVVVTKYWMNFEVIFITAQPFLDSLNTYVNVESLDSGLYFYHTFTFISVIKKWNDFTNFTIVPHTRYYFWIFFVCCGKTIFFSTIHWMVNVNKFIYSFLQNPICFFLILVHNMPTF